MSNRPDIEYPDPFLEPLDDGEFESTWEQFPHLLKALNGARMGAWHWHVNSGRITGSRASQAIFGIDTDKQPRKRIDYFSLVPQADHKQIRALFTDICRGNLSEQTMRHRIMWPDGSLHWLEINASLKRDEDQIALYGVVRDITCQQEQAHALAESSRSFDSLFQLSPDSVALVRKADSIITAVNQHFENSFGWSSPEICGKSTFDANIWTEPNDRDTLRTALESTLEPLSKNVTLRRRDGSLTDGILSVQLIEIDQVDYVLCTFTDTCEKKRTEQALRFSEEKFAKAFQYSPDAVVISEKYSGKLIQVNPSFERQFGWSNANAIGKTASQLGVWQHPQDRMRMIEALEANSLQEFEVELCDKQGKPSTKLLFGDEIELNNHDCLILTIRDISRQKSQERALKDSQARLDLALDSANLGTWDWHIPNKTLFGSQRAAMLHGLPAEEYQGPFSTFFSHVHAQDQQRMYQDYRALLASDQPTYQLTYRSQLPDSSTRYLECIAQLSRDAAGNPLRLTGVVMDVTERTLREQTLAASEEKYSALFQASPEPICVSRAEDGTMIEVNPSFCRTFGWSQAELIGSKSTDLKIWRSPDQRIELHERFMRDHELNNEVVQFITRSGKELTCILSSRLITVDQHECITTTFRDITDQQAAEAALEASQDKFAKAFHSSPDAITITERATGRYIEVNEGFHRLTGHRSEDIIGLTANDINIWESQAERQRVLDRIQNARSTVHMEMRCRHRDGNIIPVDISVQTIELNNVPCLLMTVRDLSELKEAQAQVQHLAYHDSLTNLPNRALLMDRLSQQIALLKRHDLRGALLFLDLDHFKHINDSLGHPVGDSVLKMATARLEASVRMEDTVARLGGDEFVILLSGLEGDMSRVTELVYRLADGFRSLLAEPMLIDGHRLQVTPSIGMALIPDHGQTPADLLKRADIALYRAKDLGRDTVQMFDASMQEVASERLRLESDLRLALQRSEFELYFQPQVDALTNQIIGAEALLRWNHPVLGAQSPARFIHILEESGLILEVGSWVLNEACASCVALIDEGLIAPENFSLCVNISPRQFRQKDFVQRVENCLRQSSLPMLKLEITEGIVIQNIEDAIAKMNKLKKLGISFAMDDFGTGYSSLTYLKKLPVDVIKIDKSFIQDSTSDPNDAEIIRAIIAMAHSLELTLIAEGVEEQEQLDFLLKQNCNLYQGYLFSKPLPLDAFRQLLRDAQNPLIH
ncbi:Sensory box protein [Pseudomonas marincola]|uniref:Sensory box protein n=1 Tax=Pseudomonas marincola TaxID=437900 RepID=A0A653EBJ6_9PSED|nr:PAS domain S-box protein [Pseudomonas marincola]CAE6928800.1 Sensory box protein [Pseudomonas marincola]